MNRLLLTLVLLPLLAPNVRADEPGIENPPVAVRYWGQGMVSIETWWNLTVLIDPYDERIGYDKIDYEEIGNEGPKLTADLVLVTREHADYNKADGVKGKPKVLKGLEASGKVRAKWGVLDRSANSKSLTWQQGFASESHPKNLSPQAIKVETITVRRDDLPEGTGGTAAIFVVEVDGVRIAHLGECWPSKLTKEQLELLGKIDVLCVPQERGKPKPIDSKQVIVMMEQIHPRFFLTLEYKRDLYGNTSSIGNALWVKYPGIMVRDGNTFAITAAVSKEEQPIRNLILMLKPDQPSEELAGLMKKMDESCLESQKIFAPLSVKQMSWRPSNGTHTPRWNAEHMMGRQLGFFSQIFAAIDHQLFEEVDPKWSMMLPIDLNPKQMPADYQPAHPDWDGAEEARQMQRVNAYVQRFAYLLDRIDLGEKAPGSRWTLRGLLKQMDRHFTEHTANVQKKCELEGWPEK